MYIRIERIVNKKISVYFLTMYNNNKINRFFLNFTICGKYNITVGGYTLHIKENWPSSSSTVPRRL